MAQHWGSHCHLQLSPLFEQAEAILEKAASKGVLGCIVPSYSSLEWPRQLLLSQRPGVRNALGVHPWSLTERKLTPIDQLEESFLSFAESLGRNLVAVGEFGLDRSRAEFKECFAAQTNLFRAHLRWADKLHLPVIIHSVRALGKTLELLQLSPPGKGGVLHSYAGPPEMVDSFSSLGLYFSYSGNLKTSAKARESLKRTSPERILFETDGPFSKGLGVGNEAVGPHHLPEVLETASQILGKSVEWCWSVHDENTERLFRIQETT